MILNIKLISHIHFKYKQICWKIAYAFFYFFNIFAWFYYDFWRGCNIIAIVYLIMGVTSITRVRIESMNEYSMNLSQQRTSGVAEDLSGDAYSIPTVPLSAESRLPPGVPPARGPHRLRFHPLSLRPFVRTFQPRLALWGKGNEAILKRAYHTFSTEWARIDDCFLF